MWSEEFQAHVDQELLSLTSLCATLEQWWGEHPGVASALESYKAHRINALRVEAARQLGPGWVPWGSFYRSPGEPPTPCVCTRGKEHTLKRVVRGIHTLYEDWDVGPDSRAVLQLEEARPNLQRGFMLAVYTGESVLPAVPTPEATLAQLTKRLSQCLGYSQELDILAVLGSGTLIGRRLHGTSAERGLSPIHITRVQGKTIHTSDGRVWERFPTSASDGELRPVWGTWERSPTSEEDIVLTEGWAVIEGTCAWLRWRQHTRA